jgi:poly(3-hydroxybutyrate) depolymerase
MVIIFHGNGGTAEGSLKHWQWLKDHILVAPQGYRRSWNVYGEKSTAPDVEFFRLLMQEVRRTQPTADPERVSLIGSSNGSGFVQRLMIEMDDRPFQKAILLVASLIDQQYHDGHFWEPSKSTQVYDKQRTPKPGMQLVYFHGTADRVVPYTGGYRGRRFLHLGAQETAWHWATAFGYSGAALSDRDGERVSRGIFSYAYPDAGVTHYKLVGAGHGVEQYSAQVHQIVQNFLGSDTSN